MPMTNGLSKDSLKSKNTAVKMSKGMGNVETLLGCGKNIYYAFLVKCQRFVNLMERPLMTPLLLRELDRRG